MPKLRLHLTFPEQLIRDPIIWRLSKQYDIITNIRRANVEENVGWVILEAEGTEEALDQGSRGWARWASRSTASTGTSSRANRLNALR